MVTRRFEILPAIDLRDGRVVRLKEGDFAQETVFSDDPSAVADDFARAGARWLHVVDLDGARTGVSSHGRAIAAIVEAVRGRTSVELAGGLRDAEAVAAALRAGAARVVIGTAALFDATFAGRLIEAHGAGRLAVAIDIREGLAVGHGWSSEAAGIDAGDAIRRLADVGVETFEVTAIERDGLLEGPNLELYERLVAVDRGAIIGSGGVTSIDDITALREVGCAGAIVGRAFYEGRLGLTDALDAAQRSDQG